MVPCVPSISGTVPPCGAAARRHGSTQRVERTDKKSKPGHLLRTIDKFQRTQAEEHLTSQDDGFKCIVFVNNRVSRRLPFLLHVLAAQIC